MAFQHETSLLWRGRLASSLEEACEQCELKSQWVLGKAT